MEGYHMSTELARYRRNPTEVMSSNRNTAIIVGAVIFVALILYLLLRNKTSLSSGLPPVKQWQIKYNEDGQITNITNISLPKDI